MVTPYVWGHRGLGKSALIQQLCANNNWGFIDLRCSQLEASDIRGMPNPGEDGRTHYLPPADMPVADMTLEQLSAELGKVPSHDNLIKYGEYLSKRQDMQRHFPEGILFLDEVNRAQDDVLQSIFQLVLDRRVGQYVLPPGWSIAAAGNFMEGYVVNGFNDPAFLNRFCHMTLSTGETTLEEWVNYMSTVHAGEASDVIEFASQNMKHLDGDVQGELGFTIQPSRRSWETVTRVQTTYRQSQDAYGENAYTEVLSGLVGRELASAFLRYSCPVKPRALLQDGVAAHAKSLKKLTRNQMVGLMWGLVSFCKQRIDEDKVAAVCLDFASYMIEAIEDKDIVVAFCRALVSTGNSNDNQEKARAAIISNPELAALFSKYRARTGNTKKTFVDRLNERPELQQALSRVSWGSSSE